MSSYLIKILDKYTSFIITFKHITTFTFSILPFNYSINTSEGIFIRFGRKKRACLTGSQGCYILPLLSTYVQ
ncbi:MAG: hypothetical protein FD170_3405 [Bacteroidetes bacterium]|nr:MAG: hypothetical protein FD170_3405 [Bacteroidota bacterium]